MDIMGCHGVSWNRIGWSGMAWHVGVGWDVRSRHVMPCHVMPCHFMSCHTYGTSWFDPHRTICRIQNPDIQRAGRNEAAPGGTVGRGGDGQDGTPTDRFAKETIVPLTFQTIADNPPGCVSGSTNKENPI